MVNEKPFLAHKSVSIRDYLRLHRSKRKPIVVLGQNLVSELKAGYQELFEIIALGTMIGIHSWPRAYKHLKNDFISAMRHCAMRMT